MSVGRICVREVDLVDANESVQTAAARMHDRKVGSLVILDEGKQPVGIVTDRDLTTRVLAQGLDCQTMVAEVMTSVPKTVTEDTPIEAALSVMRGGAFRRIPVVDRDGKLVGLLSIDDVLDLLAEEFRQIGELLQRENPSSLSQV